MTAGTRANIKFGLIAAAALVCSVLAGLGCFRAFPMFAGTMKRVFLAGAAVAMAAQGAALIPTKWESRLIVRPQALAAGSLVLFTGAALILVLLFAGCAPTGAAKHPRAKEDFYTAANRPDSGACSAMTRPSPWHRNDAVENAAKDCPLAGGAMPLAGGSAIATAAQLNTFGVCASDDNQSLP